MLSYLLLHQFSGKWCATELFFIFQKAFLGTIFLYQNSNMKNSSRNKRYYIQKDTFLLKKKLLWITFPCFWGLSKLYILNYLTAISVCNPKFVDFQNYKNDYIKTFFPSFFSKNLPFETFQENQQLLLFTSQMTKNIKNLLTKTTIF
jgi:hypothetical protein